MFDHPGQSELRIFGSLRETAGEVIEACGKPGIKLAQPVHAQRDQALREKFGERRSHSLKVRACRNEMNISIHGKARSRKDSIAAHGLNAGQARCFNELKPLFNAARAAAVAIVIEQPLAPCDSKALVVRARQ